MQKKYSEEVYNVYDIAFGDIDYKYYLLNGEIEGCIQQLIKFEGIDSIIVISDENVGTLYGQSLVRQIRNICRCDLLIFECTEKHKNIHVLGELVEKVLALNASRQTCIVGLGGGICGNMSGMVAALLFRGIKFVHIPTTLMAISDSVLSLKQAINSNFGKNLIGVFYTPEMVIANIGFMQSLPKSQIVSGMCEVIKNVLTILPDRIEQLYKILNEKCIYTDQDYRYVIDLSISAKTTVMKHDPFEKHDALILEYGHTIGHAIELASSGQISHGEAVGMGMLCAAEISHMLGYMTGEEVSLHARLLQKAGALTKLAGNIKMDDILSIIKFDNKRGYINVENGYISMVLMEKIGKPLKNNGKMLTGVPEAIIRQAITSIIN